MIAGTLFLVVALMYWGRPVLIPVALATLLTFLLSPVDSALQRLGLSRVFSVALLAGLILITVAVIGWVVSLQVQEFAHQLPAYQGNIKKRIADLQVGQGTPLDRVRHEIEELIGDVTTNSTSSAKTEHPILVAVQGGAFSSGLWQFSPVVRPFLETISYIVLVAMLVIFMLLERVSLRQRVTQVFGGGRWNLTTQALDEAGERVSRYLFAQFIINVCLGVVIGLGLFFLGVPYSVLWGFLIVLLRFVPYVGIWVAALLPLAVSLATTSNWWQPLSVIALFAILEPLVAMIIEPMLFSQSAGTSKLAMLIAIVFWAWLWGPIGLLLATPLTACLAVVAKYVPQLDFIAVLLGDENPRRST